MTTIPDKNPTSDSNPTFAERFKAWWRNDFCKWEGSLVHVAIALGIGLGLAALVVFATLAIGGPEISIGVLAAVGFGLLAAASICRAYAHPNRKKWDYSGKLLGVATLGFTGTAAAAKFPEELNHGILLACGAALVLLICALIVYRSAKSLRDQVKHS